MKELDFEKIKPASKETIERMKKLRQLPKPSLKNVLKQMEASAEYRRNKQTKQEMDFKNYLKMKGKINELF